MDNLLINRYKTNLPIPRGLTEEDHLPYVPWSFSALEKFEACEYQYGEINVKKNYPFVPSEQMNMGSEVHAALEKHITYGAELPMGLIHIGKLIKTLSIDAVQITGEQPINFTNMMQICDTFHCDVGYRGKIDMLVLRKDDAFVVDFKTGSDRYTSEDQLIWMCIAVLLKYSQYDKVYGIFIYTKHPLKRVEVNRFEIPRYIKEMYPRLERLEHARRNNIYNKTPGYQCKWCPVKLCEFYQKK